VSGLIEAEKVNQVFGARSKHPTVAVKELTLTLDVESAPFTAVVGESGSGKTTLARILLGFQEPVGGQVRYLGQDVYHLRRAQRSQFRRDVQAIFQDPFAVYNPFYKVDHLLVTPMKNFGLAHSRDDMYQKIEAALEHVGLEPGSTLGRYPHQLSGGQRQRLTVARALLVRPRLVVADEPVSMVDASLRATILDTLRDLNAEFDIAFLYITHDLATAYQVSTNIIVMYQGRVMEAGQVESVIHRPAHPYTRLLVESVPTPDPTKGWGDSDAGGDGGAEETVAPPTVGCPFAPRCPAVMDRCRQEDPPLYRISEHQAAACFLHEDLRQTVDGDLAAVFDARRPAEAPLPAGSGIAPNAGADTQGD